MGPREELVERTRKFVNEKNIISMIRRSLPRAERMAKPIDDFKFTISSCIIINCTVQERKAKSDIQRETRNIKRRMKHEVLTWAVSGFSRRKTETPIYDELPSTSSDLKACRHIFRKGIRSCTRAGTQRPPKTHLGPFRYSPKNFS